MPGETPTYSTSDALDAARRLNDPTPQNWLEKLFPGARSVQSRERRAEIADQVKHGTKEVGRVALATAAIIGIPGTVGFLLYQGYELATAGDRGPYFGELNTEVTAVSILDEARFREMPAVNNNPEGSNIIEQVDLPDGATMTIKTPEGVYTKDDEYNGNWIGIRVEDLPQSLADAAHASGDRDDIVWVSTQTAVVVKDPNG